MFIHLTGIDLNPFKKVLNTINKIITKTKINFNFIDLGGGIGISYSGKEKKFNLNIADKKENLIFSMAKNTAKKNLSCKKRKVKQKS